MRSNLTFMSCCCPSECLWITKRYYIRMNTFHQVYQCQFGQATIYCCFCFRTLELAAGNRCQCDGIINSQNSGNTLAFEVTQNNFIFHTNKLSILLNKFDWQKLAKTKPNKRTKIMNYYVCCSINSIWFNGCSRRICASLSICVLTITLNESVCVCVPNMISTSPSIPIYKKKKEANSMVVRINRNANTNICRLKLFFTNSTAWLALI